jgi:hypothetical protein
MGKQNTTGYALKAKRIGVCANRYVQTYCSPHQLLLNTTQFIYREATACRTCLSTYSILHESIPTDPKRSLWVRWYEQKYIETVRQK